MSVSDELRRCRPIVLGLRGPLLDPADRQAFADIRPVGAILFARNIESIDQTRALCADLGRLLPDIGRDGHKLIAVDQEGGRVQRLRFHGKLPAARAYGDLFAKNRHAGIRAARLHGRLLAAELRGVGATWALGPVLDLGWPQTHDVIGDRAFAADPTTVALLGSAVLSGLADGGCHGCPKHAPGHGRATSDSHVELPVIDATEAEMAATDWVPFAQLAPKAPFLMTAHIAIEALQHGRRDLPATFDGSLLSDLRSRWGFGGLWLADDLSMQALPGDYLARLRRALRHDDRPEAGGCDLVLACFSRLVHGMAGTVFDAETFDLFRAGLESVPPIGAAAVSLLRDLRLPPAPSDAAISDARSELAALLAEV